MHLHTTRTCCGGGCPLSVVVVFFVEKNRQHKSFWGLGLGKGNLWRKELKHTSNSGRVEFTVTQGEFSFPRSKKGARIQCRSPYITLNMSHYIYGTVHSTVDGQNPAPPRMMIIPLFIGF